MLAVSPALAQTDESLLLSPWEEGQRIEASGSVVWMPRSAPAGSVGLSTLMDTTSQGRIRLSEEHELNPTIGYEFTRLQIRDRLGRIPSGLIDASVAAATPLFAFGDSDSWFLAVGAGVGYAGDEPLGNGDAWYGKGTLTVGTELSKNEDLVIWLDYDGNRTLFPDIPVVHAEYVREVSDEFSFIVGLPDSSLTWKPNPGLKVELSWEAPLSFGASVEQSLGGGWKLYSAYTDVTEAYHLESLRDVDRLFYESHRIEGGIKYEPREKLSISAAVGYGFGQSLRTGFSELNWQTLAHLPDRPYLSFAASIAF